MIQDFEYALLSADAYRDARGLASNDAPIPPGWTELTSYARSGSGVGASSFRANRGSGLAKSHLMPQPHLGKAFTH